jgi:GNAT superfamily N-acetyltransferase
VGHGGAILRVRDARPEDLDALERYSPKRSVHSDRIRDALGVNCRYLVVAWESDVLGFGLLVFAAPDIALLPCMIDLRIGPEFRSQGVGTFLIHGMEEIARARGSREMYVGVDPEGNERAYSLYLRLGYRPVQSKPYMNSWRLTSSDGEVHTGRDWHIDLRREL